MNKNEIIIKALCDSIDKYSSKEKYNMNLDQKIEADKKLQARDNSIWSLSELLEEKDTLLKHADSNLQEATAKITGLEARWHTQGITIKDFQASIEEKDLIIEELRKENKCQRSDLDNAQAMIVGLQLTNAVGEEKKNELMVTDQVPTPKEPQGYLCTICNNFINPGDFHPCKDKSRDFNCPRCGENWDDKSIMDCTEAEGRCPACLKLSDEQATAKKEPQEPETPQHSEDFHCPRCGEDWYGPTEINKCKANGYCYFCKTMTAEEAAKMKASQE